MDFYSPIHPIDIRNLAKFDLANHPGLVRFGENPTARTGNLGAMGSSSENRRLLNGHGNQNPASIDKEIGGNPQGNRGNTNHIFHCA